MIVIVAVKSLLRIHYRMGGNRLSVTRVPGVPDVYSLIDKERLCVGESFVCEFRTSSVAGERAAEVVSSHFFSSLLPQERRDCSILREILS